jgi:PAS domain S-box-containing protein
MSSASREQLRSLFQKMVEGVEGYTLILLDVDGTILTWNKGVQRLKGYTSDEILGQHISMFYLPEDRQEHLPEKLLEEARANGRAINVGRRIRKNGTIFWGSIEITAIRNDSGEVIGFTNLARELRDEHELGHFWFDPDGVLNTRAGKTPPTPEKILEFRNLIGAGVNNPRLCCIADLRDAVVTDAVLSFAQADVARLYKAVAFISNEQLDPTTQRVLASMPAGLPVKVFTSRDAARAWIRQYL